MYIFFAKGFRKSFDKLPRGVKEQCSERLHLFDSTPHHPLLENHALQGEYAGYRSINVTGDYRAIFRYEMGNFVTFMHVGTHHELFGS